MPTRIPTVLTLAFTEQTVRDEDAKLQNDSDSGLPSVDVITLVLPVSRLEMTANAFPPGPGVK